MRWIRILACCVAATCLIGVALCGGCAQMAANKALKQYTEQLDPAIGQMTRDDYVKLWGPPESTTAVSDGEVCVWRFSYGSRSVSGGGQFSLSTRMHEVYDRLTLTFDKGGVLQSWRAWSQR